MVPIVRPQRPNDVPIFGRVAEWPNASVLKTEVRSADRGFESYLFRPFYISLIYVAERTVIGYPLENNPNPKN